MTSARVGSTGLRSRWQLARADVEEELIDGAPEPHTEGIN